MKSPSPKDPGHHTPAQSGATGQPLEGIRVIEMATLGMGPLAAQSLGDYGAEVIKVEPIGGDLFRQTTPRRSEGMGHTFLQFNRNKKSLAIDVKSERGIDLVRRLVRGADVFLSNTRSPSMARLGLDYDSLRGDNPELIYCACYGFSDLGPYAGRPAADDTIQAMSGLVDLQAKAGGGANFTASVVADKVVAMTIVNAVMAALMRRMKHGGGQFLEVPMFESMVAFVMPEHMAGKTYEPQQGAVGYSRLLNPNRVPFPTRDGLLCVLPYTDKQWGKFFTLIGRPDLAESPDYATLEGRGRNIEAVYAVIRSVLPSKTTAEWIALLAENDILYGEVNSVEELFSDPHLTARAMFPEYDHPTEGRIRLIGYPVVSSEPATRLRHLPPTLGAHSAEIARMAGLSDETIAVMVAAGELVDPAMQDPVR